MNIMIIDAKTKGLGLIGHPVEHSFSPAIHNAISKSLGLNYVYTAHDVHPEQVEQAILGLDALGYKGTNVTVPHKTAVIDALTELTEEAKLIGAVNTILFDKGKRIGYNTDCYGFAKMLDDEGVTLSGKKVLILGTGGASRAVVAACVMHNTDTIYICSREAEKSECYLETFDKSSDTVKNWHATAYNELDEIANNVDFDIVINCTPLGMHPNTGVTPVNIELFKKECVLVDLIYNPAVTEFLLLGEKRGMKTVNGLGMLIHQALEAYRIWTGETQSAQFVRNALENQGVI